jgi:hypothetical protein
MDKTPTASCIGPTRRHAAPLAALTDLLSTSWPSIGDMCTPIDEDIGYGSIAISLGPTFDKMPTYAMLTLQK